MGASHKRVTFLTLTALVTATLVLSAPSAHADPCPIVDASGIVTPPPAAAVDWSHCDLTGADLTSAVLDDAVLSSTNLTNANLSNASVVGARLDAANLTTANLTGTDLSRALLDGVI